MTVLRWNSSRDEWDERRKEFIINNDLSSIMPTLSSEDMSLLKELSKNHRTISETESQEVRKLVQKILEVLSKPSVQKDPEN